MMAIPKDVIERIRDLADIVETVGQMVTLKKTGNHFTGLCPFHREKTPSFKVFPESQNFHCFGCGEGGSVFDFVMKAENLSFPEAVRVLAETVGVEVPRWETDEGEERLVAELGETLEMATRYYERQLASAGGKRARDYLSGRGLDQETLTGFRLGWAPAGWDGLVEALAQMRDGAALERAGLAIPGRRGHYDRFRDRVIFPITSASGQVLGFGGRVLGTGEPKYLNTPETKLYRKSRVLYGLSRARQGIREEKRVLVVEGYTDVLALHQAGVTNVVATCGTALTGEHARLLARFAPEVVFVFDGDAAGVRAALKGFEALLPSGARVRAVPLPEGRDPDDLVREEGADAFREFLNGSQDLVEFFHVQSRGEPKPQALERLARLVALVPEPIPRRELAARAAEAFRFDESTFAREAERIASGRRPEQSFASASSKPQGHRPRGLEADLLRACLQDPGFWGEVRAVTRHPDLKRVVAERVRAEVLSLLDEVAAAPAPLPPSAYRGHMSDPAVQGFLMELASEGALPQERLYQLERDLMRLLPQLALEMERGRLRSSLTGAARGSDREKEQAILKRLHEVNRKLDELLREGNSSLSR